MRKRFEVVEGLTIEMAEELLQRGIATEVEDGKYAVPVVDERRL